MDRKLECPHCASSDLEVTLVSIEPRKLALRCKGCSARGHESLDLEKDAVFAWNQRMGRLTVVR